MEFKVGQRVKFIGFHINGSDSTEVFEYENFLKSHEEKLIGKEGVITEIDSEHTHPLTVEFDVTVADEDALQYWKEAELELL